MIKFKCYNCGKEGDFNVSARIRKTRIMIMIRCPNCGNTRMSWEKR